MRVVVAVAILTKRARKRKRAAIEELLSSVLWKTAK